MPQNLYAGQDLGAYSTTHLTATSSASGFQPATSSTSGFQLATSGFQLATSGFQPAALGYKAPGPGYQISALSGALAS
jgi:peptidoglycan hydrolase-like protein with peptidoglycan-binding domain